MKTRFISFFSLVLIFAVLFTACGGTVGDTQEDETTKAPETAANPETSDLDETTKSPETTNAPDTTKSPETTKAPETERPIPEVELVEHTYLLKDSENLYKKLGRAYLSNGSLCLNPSAAGVEFTAVCKGDITVKLSVASAKNRFMVMVDGTKVEHNSAAQGSEFKVASGLAEGWHTIRIVNENDFLSIESVTLVGELQTPDESDVYIEIVGDSVAEGCGLYNLSAHCHTRAFGYLAVEALGVDYGYCARGGTAICYAGDRVSVMENLYPYQDKILRETGIDYTPTRTPDLVIVELSQNDDWQWQSGKILPDGSMGTEANKSATTGYYNYETFDAAFDRLVEMIYETNGSRDIPILFVFGCMTSTSFHTGSDRAKYLVDKYIDDGYDFKQVVLTTDRTGLESHPTPKGAAKQARELVDFLLKEYPELGLSLKHEISDPAESEKGTESELPAKPDVVEGTGKLSLDFDTTDDFAAYMAKEAENGLALINRFTSGQIKENMYYNPGNQCCFEDLTRMMFGGADNGNKFGFTVSFKIKFETFSPDPNHTVFNYHGYKTDNEIGNWNKLFVIDPDGRMHMDSSKNKNEGVVAELGRWYEIKIVIDGTKKTASLFIDDTDCGSMSYSSPVTASGKIGFRLGNGGGAKFYLDDLVIVKN